MTTELRAIDRRAAELMGWKAEFECRWIWVDDESNGGVLFNSSQSDFFRRHPDATYGCSDCDREGYDVVNSGTCVRQSNEEPHFSSDPYAANLLIEDLRKRGVQWMSVGGPDGHTMGFTEGYAQEHGYSAFESAVVGDTWMGAVTRFYIAVREEQE